MTEDIKLTKDQIVAHDALKEIISDLVFSKIGHMIATILPLSEAIFFGNKSILALDESGTYIHDYILEHIGTDDIQNIINEISEKFNNNYSAEERMKMREALAEYEINSIYADIRKAMSKVSYKTVEEIVLNAIISNEDTGLLIKQVYWETCWKLKFASQDTVYYFQHPSVDDILCRLTNWSGDILTFDIFKEES